MEEHISKSENKKILRKHKKLQHALIDHCGIKSQDEPTKFIAVLNAGVATGLDEEELLKVCEQYGRVERLVMLPAESFCFLVLDSIESSRCICEHVNGSTKLAQGGHPLYLTYVPSILETEYEQSSLPEGLTLLANFINNEEENLLLSLIDWEEAVESSNHMKHRRVKHFGYEFMYSNNNIDLNKPLDQKIPNECNFLWSRLQNLIIEHPPNQLTVNQYNPGQGIPSHIDTHSAFLSPILSLSLGGDVVMEFKLKQKKHNVLLPARSLLIMDGAARYEWSHGIAPRSYDLVNGRTRQRSQRVSFTFRWVRPDGKCDCSYPLQCDTALRRTHERNSNLDEELAAIIEKQHVHDVYNKIASHFDDTRTKIWTSVRCFVESLPCDSLLVDVGCGNGKNLRLRTDIMQIGVEYNATLSEVAMYEDRNKLKLNQNNIEVVRGDCLCLPFKSSSVDAVISIAVFHHLATKERRIQAINEVIRILRPGGKTLITVWAKDQCRGEKTSYLKQDRKNRKADHIESEVNADQITEEIKDSSGKSLNVSLPVHVNRRQFQHQDTLVPWKLKKHNDEARETDETFMRYYHVFEEGELEELCREIRGIHLIQSFYEQGNWCVTLKKMCS